MIPYDTKQVNYEEVSEKLKCIAHPIRLQILHMLLMGQKNVSELYTTLEAPQSTISQHIAKLRSVHIVKGERKGLEVYYHVIDEQIVDILKLFIS